MARLIIHIGPGKCGSSTIQDFFQSKNDPCIEKTGFVLLHPKLVAKLNRESPRKERLLELRELIDSAIANKDVLILSHEFLFQCPFSIRNICRLIQDEVSDIRIIGYSRRQSGFMASSYAQWLFRSPERVQEVCDILERAEINTDVFSGLERHFIASILDEFNSARQMSNHLILDWNRSYKAIQDIIWSAKARVVCGLLPMKGEGESLIQDFCDKAELKLKDSSEKGLRSIRNKSFDPSLVEQINKALLGGAKVPGPHSNNKSLYILSSLTGAGSFEESAFMASLKSYVDAYFQESNIKLCETYGLDASYFHEEQAITKSEIMNIVRNEMKRRKTEGILEPKRSLLTSVYLKLYGVFN